jgi:hypothetical protein
VPRFYKTDYDIFNMPFDAVWFAVSETFAANRGKIEGKILARAYD